MGEPFGLPKRVCGLTHYKQAVPLGTLAAAYAEDGRFPRAIGTRRACPGLGRAPGYVPAGKTSAAQSQALPEPLLPTVSKPRQRKRPGSSTAPPAVTRNQLQVVKEESAYRATLTR